MKFFSIVSAALSLSSVALGAPALQQRQAPTPAEAITNSVKILAATAADNQQQMDIALANAKNNVNAAVSIAASVSANLDAIAKGFEKAGEAIAASIEAAVGGILGQAAAVGQAEIEDLKDDIIIIQKILAGLSATLTVEVTNLIPSAQAAVMAEATFVTNAIAPVVNPVMVFADAVSKAKAKASATVNGLADAYTGATVVINQFAATNGLPGVSFPGYVVPVNGASGGN